MDFYQARRQMVEDQLAARGITDRAVLSAMSAVPRERFVRPSDQAKAYDDTPLPIEAGQTISQPWIVAHMIEAAGVAKGQRVLEIGAGSGYAAAIMAKMGAQVTALERLDALARPAAERLARLGYRVDLRCADGSEGFAEAAPFDAIIVSAGAPAVPPALPRQLAIGGRLVIPVGEAFHRQDLLRITRVDPDEWTTESLGAVVFVPLIGKAAWGK